jgi:hypothetical protein
MVPLLLIKQVVENKCDAILCIPRMSFRTCNATARLASISGVLVVPSTTCPHVNVIKGIPRCYSLNPGTHKKVTVNVIYSRRTATSDVS